MNIFYLDHNMERCAQYHCDKHVVKMIVEYAQLLSTCKRILDGEKHVVLSKRRRKQIFLLPGESITYEDGKAVVLNAKLYQATHVNHPCNKWLRESKANYDKLFTLFESLLREYTHRYGKIHATSRLSLNLQQSPNNLKDAGITSIPQAMPEEYQCADPVEAYRSFYRGSKVRFARWTNREKPEWF